MTAILNTARCSRSLATFLPGMAAIGCISVLRERLAKVCFSAFSLAFAGDRPKSNAVKSDGHLSAFVLSDKNSQESSKLTHRLAESGLSKQVLKSRQGHSNAKITDSIWRSIVLHKELVTERNAKQALYELSGSLGAQ
jgi:hypothetical protein